VRAEAAQALGELDNLDAVQPLVATLEDDVSQVRWCVVGALGDLKATHTTQILITFLKEDPEAVVRWYTAQSLAQLGDPAAIQPLIAAALKDKDGTVRRIAANTFNQFSEDPIVSI
jgi:HEAT repeat protein